MTIAGDQAGDPDMRTEPAGNALEAPFEPQGRWSRMLGVPTTRLTTPGWRMTMLAGAFAAGIAIGWNLESPNFPLLLGIACTCLASGILLHRRHAWVVASSCLCMFFLGAAWLPVHHRFVSPDALPAIAPGESAVLRLRGIALDEPELRARPGGLMARFDYRQPATYFQLRAEESIDEQGHARPARGDVMVRVDETLEPFRAGDHLEVTGVLIPPRGPMNPGEYDFRALARARGQAGLLAVDDRENVRVLSPRRGILGHVRDWHATLKRKATGWLLDDLPGEASTSNHALLAALLLGARRGDLDGLDTAFTRVGLAHILAISGMNLGLLAGAVLWVLRLSSGRRRWHAWFMMAIVLLYLAMIDLRAPVLRAGVMVIAACLGRAMGRRLHVAGLVSLSMIALLAWQPEQLFDVGFQLSYGVVFALIHLAPAVRERWFGPVNHVAPTVPAMLWEHGKTVLAAGAAAWLAATPFTIVHFGIINPLGAPASLLAVPVASIVMILGYLRMVLSLMLPSSALLLGWPLEITTDWLTGVVRCLDSVPGIQVHVPFGSATWACAALLWVSWWCWRQRHEGRPAVMWLCAAALTLWLAWPVWIDPLIHPRPVLRIDTISVGDGTCHVVRSGDSTVLFDAGSTNLGTAKFAVIPAMRRLGVTGPIDAIAISHANLDHYSDVLDLVQEFGLRELIVTPQFIARAHERPTGAPAFLLEQCAARSLAITPASESLTRLFGNVTWEWLAPEHDIAMERVNDESMLVRLTAANHTILFCGDIGPDGIEASQDRWTNMRADVVELPHHGSFNDAAANFIATLQPSLVLQSTGHARWSRDRWGDLLAQRLPKTIRLVTARDGACWVEITKDGTMTAGSFLNGRCLDVPAAVSPLPPGEGVESRKRFDG